MIFQSWLASLCSNARLPRATKVRARSHQSRFGARATIERLEPRVVLTTIDLSNLGARGVTLSGGYAVSGAGDVNGDGFDDLIVGVDARPVGASYVVFGGPSMPQTVDLAALGDSGVTILGANAEEPIGGTVSDAGDVNGDGFDDLIVGISYSHENVGSCYVVFGQSSMPQTINLTNLGRAGVSIRGIEKGDIAGSAVSSAGDINGDGFDDIAIGAPQSEGIGNSEPDAGECYVIFGGSALPEVINLANLGDAGVTIYGANRYDAAGHSLSAAGDVNGDGFGDLLIGAYTGGAYLYGEYSGGKPFLGRNYVIYGRSSLPATIDLGNLDAAGVKIAGTEAGDLGGWSVSGAGDFNGDGFDDVLLSAFNASGVDNKRERSGESYVVFGDSALPGKIVLPTNGTSRVMTILGADRGDGSGWSVSSAGDVNSDGFDDILVLAIYSTDSTRWNSRDGYLLFGNSSPPNTVDLANIGPANVTLFSAGKMSDAGDVNGDGFADFLSGPRLVFGSNSFTNSVTLLGTSDSETLTGTSAANVINGAGGNDTLIGSGGADVIYGGEGEDVVAISDLRFKRLDGGNGSDTLRVDGAGIALDLATVADNRLTSFETIDLRGSGANTLTLDLLEVLNVTSNSNPVQTTNTLTVRRDSDDTINIGAGWFQALDVIVGGTHFQSFTQGQAILRLEVPNSVIATIVTATLVEGTVVVRTSHDTVMDVAVFRDDIAKEIVVQSGMDVVGAIEIRFPASMVTDGLIATLSSQDDRFDAARADIPVSISGGDGDDSLTGGSGSDQLVGGTGADTLIGGSQADALDGQEGNDVLTGGAGSDSLDGGSGNDTLSEVFDRNITLTNSALGLSGNAQTIVVDRAIGFEFATLTGGISANKIDVSSFTKGIGTTISGGGQSDTILGSFGPDLIITLTGNDVINGLGGADTVYSGSGNDTIHGGDGADSLIGQNGNDSIRGDAGADTLVGGAGIDTMNGGAANDFLSAQADGGLLNGGDGNDTLLGSAAGDTLIGEAGNDRLIGLQHHDWLYGGDGADTLLGGSASDHLYGGTGADDLRGEAGSDYMDGGQDFDRINEIFDFDVTITGRLITTADLWDDETTNVERINLLGGPSANLFDAREASVSVLLWGGAGNDTLLGGSKSDIINGGNGDDVLSGGASNDILDGGAGTDDFYEKADANFIINAMTTTSAVTGTDTPTAVERLVIIGGVGANKFDATLASVSVVLIGGRGNDTLLGGSGDDVLSGGNRNDASLPGGDGADSLDGAGGADVLENDPADTKVTGAGDTSVADIFTLLPSWVDAI